MAIRIGSGGLDSDKKGSGFKEEDGNRISSGLQVTVSVRLDAALVSTKESAILVDSPYLRWEHSRQHRAYIH